MRRTVSAPGARKTPIQLDEQRLAWARQPTEPAASYEAFRKFAQLPPRERIAKHLDPATVGLALATIQEYATRFRWFLRAEAWDAHKTQVELDHLDELRRDHLTRTRAQLNDLQTIVSLALERKLKSLRASLEDASDGLGDVTINELARVLRDIDIVERRAFPETLHPPMIDDTTASYVATKEQRARMFGLLTEIRASQKS
jgi:hypothetical protein